MALSIPYRKHLNVVDSNIEILTLEILTLRYKTEFIDNFEPIGNIKFQRSIGETKWYGITYNFSNTNFNHLSTYYKLMNKINKELEYDFQPDEIIELINGVEYFLINNELFNSKNFGLYCYSIVSKGDLYSKIIAKNRNQAYLKLQKIIDNKPQYRNKNFSISEAFLIG